MTEYKYDGIWASTLLKKIKDDHFVSKMGEEACKMVLSEFCSVTGPDYTIYAADKKGLDADKNARPIE